jgi:hypothetical protein
MLGVSLVVVFLLWAHGRDTTVGKALRWFFGRRFAIWGPEKAQKVGRAGLVFFLVVFSAFAIFGIVVGTGLVKNGDSPRTLTMDEFLEKHRK